MSIGDFLFIIAMVAIISFVFYVACTPDPRLQSLAWHRQHGKYRVLYPEGRLSQPFSIEVAQDYAKKHGGRVVPVNYKEQV